MSPGTLQRPSRRRSENVRRPVHVPEERPGMEELASTISDQSLLEFLSGSGDPPSCSGEDCPGPHLDLLCWRGGGGCGHGRWDEPLRLEPGDLALHADGARGRGRIAAVLLMAGPQGGARRCR